MSMKAILNFWEEVVVVRRSEQATANKASRNKMKQMGGKKKPQKTPKNPKKNI